ncbi:hypothetical protein E1B28_001643 [Marasmius oreades]|uniref:DRBM domain-containing protein n=1 Tax=Marasmius oreades TaxID=181124 RepID=A0A9P7V3U1_9AGAR|nr:uncharacterized protein E1B28_001643 [Marasmius oreades]KAG7099835.1 hypothetical protein E1B28_001643 [Marasmius oreades]
MTANGATHHRNRLNKYAQATGTRVEYRDSSTGPAQAPTWTSSVFLNGFHHGTGQGGTINASREQAALAALTVLSQQ